MSTSVTTTTSLITPDIASTVGKSVGGAGRSNLVVAVGDDDDDLSTTTTDSASSRAAAAAATSLLLAASTEQLNQVIRKINPFEANFREANKHFCSETSPSSLSSVATTDRNKSVGSTGDEPSSASILPTPLLGGAGAAATNQKGLLLKLPDMLGSGSSGLPSASVETPDLSSLINQVIKNGSPLIAVPQTADVLKTALELRENLDVGRQRGAAGDVVRFSFGHQGAAQSPGVLLKFHPFFGAGGGAGADKSATLNFSLTELQSPSKDFLNMNSTELIQNSLKITAPGWAVEQQRSHHQHHSIHHSESAFARHSPNKIRRSDDSRPNPATIAPSSVAQCAATQPTSAAAAAAPTSQQPPSSFMYVPVKLGDQMVYVPMLGASGADETTSQQQHRREVVDEQPALHQQSALSSTTPAAPGGSRSGSLTLKHGLSARQSPTPPSRIGQDYHQQFMEELHRKDSCSSIASPGLGPPEEEKRKESLERNKEAAWRYRKRKKEERWLLEEKAKVLESEKMDLITQVSLLKNELARVNQLLNEHKNCPLMTFSTTADYGSPPQCGKSATPRKRSLVISSSSSSTATSGGSIIIPGAALEMEDVKPVILAPSTVHLPGNSIVGSTPQHFGLVPSPFGAAVSHLTSGASVASSGASIFDNSHFDAR